MLWARSGSVSEPARNARLRWPRFYTGRQGRRGGEGCDPLALRGLPRGVAPLEWGMGKKMQAVAAKGAGHAHPVHGVPDARPAHAAESELAAAQNDVRDMQRAVMALRNELELAQAGRDAAVQLAVAEANQEVAQLKGAIAALRNELEQSHAQREQEVQQAMAANQDEMAQLKAAASALREQLELSGYMRERDLQAERSAAQDEVSQLHKTISAMRDEMERLRQSQSVQASQQ